MKSLLRSRKFWLAVVGVAQSIVSVYVPSFPKEIAVQINLLLGVVIASIAIEDAAEKASGGQPGV